MRIPVYPDYPADRRLWKRRNGWGAKKYIYTGIILELEVVFPKSDSSRTFHKAE